MELQESQDGPWQNLPFPLATAAASITEGVLANSGRKVAFVPRLIVFSATPITLRIYNILLKSLHDYFAPSEGRKGKKMYGVIAR